MTDGCAEGDSSQQFVPPYRLANGKHLSSEKFCPGPLHSIVAMSESSGCNDHCSMPIRFVLIVTFPLATRGKLRRSRSLCCLELALRGASHVAVQPVSQQAEHQVVSLLKASLVCLMGSVVDDEERQEVESMRG